MTDEPTGADQTIKLLEIQGLLAGAYEISRHTEHKFLSYLIKMARMEVGAQFDKTGSSMDDIDKPGDLDRL